MHMMNIITKFNKLSKILALIFLMIIMICCSILLTGCGDNVDDKNATTTEQEEQNGESQVEDDGAQKTPISPGRW